jgi:hypothetical protein
MDIMNNQIVTNSYIVIDKKHLGKVITILWNGNGYIVKLIGDDNYVDPMISQYELLGSNIKSGYMVVTKNNQIEIPNPDNLMTVINNYLSKQEIRNQINLKVKNNFENFITNELRTTIPTKLSNPNPNINSSILPINPIKLNNYKIEDMNEDKYAKYITQMIKEIFISDDKTLFIEENTALSNVNVKSEDVLNKENVKKEIKPTLRKLLEDYSPVDLEYYYDFKDSLVYRHIILNTDDTISAGIKLIQMIKSNLLKTQSKFELTDGENMLSFINLFDFIEYRIIDGHVELVNKFVEKDFQTVTEENCPDLEILDEMYGLPIDYKKLSEIILKNKTTQDINLNQEIIREAINIMSLEYLICLQPKVEFLLWTVNRLLYCWYSDPYLYNNIYKIKVLINLYRSRGIKEFNQDTDILPVIVIYPRYGKTIARKCMSLISYYFFPYKRYGNPNSQPTYFNKLDNLMYYTNGSLDIKKYVKFILGKNKDQIFNKDLTQVKSPIVPGKNDLQFEEIKIIE